MGGCFSARLTLVDKVHTQMIGTCGYIHCVGRATILGSKGVKGVLKLLGIKKMTSRGLFGNDWNLWM